MYFMWPVGTENYTFLPTELPNSKVIIGDIERKTIVRETFNISDAYTSVWGKLILYPNNAANGQPDAVHPDHHSFTLSTSTPLIQTFNLLSTNDGGIWLSSLSTSNRVIRTWSFEFVSTGFNTTQFYSADKMPGEDTIYRWYARSMALTFNPRRRDLLMLAQRFDFALGGDGFEVLWNNRNPQKIIGSLVL